MLNDIETAIIVLYAFTLSLSKKSILVLINLPFESSNKNNTVMQVSVCNTNIVNVRIINLQNHL